MVMPHVLRAFGDSATAKLEQLAPLMGVSGAVAAIDAMESLRESVGLPGNSEAIKTSDYEKITERALEESDGYFSPRILTAADVEQVLKSITA